MSLGGFIGEGGRAFSAFLSAHVSCFDLCSSTSRAGISTLVTFLKLDEDCFTISHDLCVSSCIKHISYNFMDAFLYIYISLGQGGLVSKVRLVTVLV